MKINIIKRIILASSLGFTVICSVQAQTWKEDGVTCHLNSQGVKVCGTHHNYYPYSSKPYHGATGYKNVKGMKTVCHYDNYGHKKCQTLCNGMLC